MRRRNLSAVLGRVHRAGPATRAELTSSSGLTRSTIGVLVAELAALGLVRERKSDEKRGPGRPSPVVEVSDDGVRVLAIDIAVDSVAVATVGLGARVHAHDRRARTERSPAATLDDIADMAAPQLAALPGGPPLAGVGVAVVGVVRRDDGLVHLAPNLGWRNLPLAKLVAEQLDLTLPVSVGNEADLGARAEHIRGAGVGAGDMLYLSGEVGIGGGIIVGGRPLEGVSGYAGEVGHVAVNPEGTTCGCGAVGCWETEAGERALLRRSGVESVAGVLEAAAAGDTRALGALAETGRWLGIGLASLVNVLNPSRVVLGRVFAELYDHFAGEVDAELARRSLPHRWSRLEVVPAALGVDAPLIGAAELALAPFVKDPVRITALVSDV